MAKVQVILRCQLDNGKEVLQPGATVSMDEARALRLADMGLVQLPAALALAVEKAAARGAGKKAAAKNAPVNEAPGPDGAGEAADANDTGIPDPDDLLNDPDSEE